MRVLLSLLLLLSLASALTISVQKYDDKARFIVEGVAGKKANLTIFVFKDDVQIMGVQRNNVRLPYPYTIPIYESGIYYIKVIDSEGNFAQSEKVDFSGYVVKKKEEKKEEDYGLALLFAGIGVAIIVGLTVSFLNLQRPNK